MFSALTVLCSFFRAARPCKLLLVFLVHHKESDSRQSPIRYQRESNPFEHGLPIVQHNLAFYHNFHSRLPLKPRHLSDGLCYWDQDSLRLVCEVL